jgi:hypothetical protein
VEIIGHPKETFLKRHGFENVATKRKNLAESCSCMNDKVLPVCSTSQYQEEWLLDSGASHHMCPHRSWFSKYQALDGSIVFMRNNVSCKIDGLRESRSRCSMVL